MRACIWRFFRGLGPLTVACLLAVAPTHAQSIRREFWSGIPGSSVSDLVGSPQFPSNPTGVDFPALFEGPNDWAEEYGTRFRGYLHPPVTGNYTLWISGDDNCVLYLSTDATPSTKVLVASVAGWTGSREWTKEANQQSSPIPLAAGQSYYVEALHKEGGGGDNVAVAWQLPNGTFEGPIPSSRLSPFLLSTNPPSILTQPRDLDLEQGQRAVFHVSVAGAEPLTFQWQRNGSDLLGKIDASLAIDSVGLDDDESRFRCLISNPLGAITSDEAQLRVRPESTPPLVLQTAPTDGVTVRSLNQVVVEFSEIVLGVSAADLLIQGTPAQSVSGLGAGPYTFTFPQPAPGTVAITWAPNHGIGDTALIPNDFAGGSWNVHLDPAAALPQLVINEFLSSNTDGLTDEDGEASDWMELHNHGATTLNLSGWSLSDNPSRPTQWIFPAVTLPPNGFLVVFASGKDRRTNTSNFRLHLNFKLSQTGEPLGLYSPESPPTLVDGFPDSYPIQRSNHSYGRATDGTWRYFSTPTPGSANRSTGLQGIAEPPRFSAQRGLYRNPFTLHLSCPTPGATIRTTIDGSEPTWTHGTPYTQPFQVNRTITLRAAAFVEGQLPSSVITHTYLVGREAANRSLPILSLVTDNQNLWGPTGIMEPANTPYRGSAWERPVSAEWIELQDNQGFAVDCGLRIQGGDYVRGNYNPNASLPFSKYSFRLYFRGDYGPSTLRYPLFPGQPVDAFDTLTLRAGMNDHSNPFITDELIRQLHADTGHISSHGTFVHLYLNGVYKGYYNPVERVDEEFLRSWTSSTNSWDLIAQNNEILSGDLVEWSRLSNTILGRDLSVPQNYAAVTELLDVDAFIDYLLVNIYSGMGDWPWNNWRAARERTPNAQWRFIIWDAEWGLGLYDRPVTVNTLTEELASSAPIAAFYRALLTSPTFRTRFADRIHRHFFNHGALTDEHILQRYWELRNHLAAAIPSMVDRIHTDWIPRRRAIIMQHLAHAGIQSSANAPSFNQHGGTVPPGFRLTLTAPAGTIYYTLDGTDPAQTTESSAHSVVLVPESAQKRALVPSTANGGHLLANQWKGAHEPFSDTTWILGSGGVGYDRSDYRPYFDIDLTDSMFVIHPSAFIRIPFAADLTSLDNLDALKLRVRYDDGFVAYLNGTLIAQANAPANPAWNSTATAGNPDTAAILLQTFDVSAHLNQVVQGQNILAIHGLNSDINSSDFLISAELVADAYPDSAPSPTATAYNLPITLNYPVTVKARTLNAGQWSALLEADFLINLVGSPLRISEILYHPAGGEAFEFIEIANLSPHLVNLAGISLDGIAFVFPEGAQLAGNACLILASNLDPAASAM